MNGGWTLNRRIAAGFATLVALTVLVGAVAAIGLNGVVSSKDHVIDVDVRLVTEAQAMKAASSESTAAARGFLLIGHDDPFIAQMTAARRAFQTSLQAVRHQADTAEGQRLISAVDTAEARYRASLDDVIKLRRTASSEAVSRLDEEQVVPRRAELLARISAFVSYEQGLANQRREESGDYAAKMAVLVALMVVAGVALAAVLAYLLTRGLRRLIGRTVGEVQTSSAELQSTANQQATSAKEQATAMNEISTTITELLATSRQIAESAQRVAQVAEQTAGSSRSGENTVATAQDSMADIRRQVDLIVKHMLELGEKSQRIGVVLDIVSELAEQTNILAINSTIEAAGAGEAGKRFAVVADEIRKLADRVADSTKEIRGLIDVVRSAVNTTVMATEIGSKAVDRGSQQFGDVAVSFQEIAGLATTTTEAAREIELSTKQQSTAVEQVKVAIMGVTQATKETESSSGQTFVTARQLSELSRELQRLVETRAAARV